MPSYVYGCECGQVLDITHSITEDPDIECNNCDSMMRRIPQSTTVTFGSGGFYTTDKND